MLGTGIVARTATVQMAEIPCFVAADQTAELAISELALSATRTPDRACSNERRQPSAKRPMRLRVEHPFA